jgi:PAP2 superfamily
MLSSLISVKKGLLVAVAVGVLATALLPAAAAKAKPAKAASLPPTAALTWHAITLTAVRSAVITADGPPRPVLQAEGRVYMAYVQAAVYDAVTKIEGRYVPYHDFGADPDDASPEAAVAAAARTTLDHYLPDQAASVDAQYGAFLASLPTAGRAAGVAVGEAAANDIIALRSNDGRNAPTAVYGDPTLPVVAGVWQVVPPATTAATPWLAFMRPFMLERPSQFRVAPPPDLGSKRYAGDLNETKAYGAQNSAVRTLEQTATAYFWNANNINQDSQAFRDVASQHGLDLVDTARVLAMGEMVAADAAIACWDSKYHYLFWRPYTAIRHADLDSNPATEADPSWLPLLNTPNHPEYPAAHGCFTAALAEVVAKVLHTRRIDLTIGGATNGGTTLTTTRHFETVKDLEREVVDARVWIGFHYRHSGIAGVRLGREVAHWSLQRYFRPIKGRCEEESDDD